MDNNKIISRLDSIEVLLQESMKKDAIISELHGDLTKQREDLLNQLRRPVLQALLKVAGRIFEIERLATGTVVLDNPEYESLRDQVVAASEYITDILSEDFDIKLIAPSAGEEYKREMHQSIEIIPTDEVSLDRTIAETIEPGYVSLSSGNVVRQATVKTYKHKENR